MEISKSEFDTIVGLFPIFSVSFFDFADLSDTSFDSFVVLFDSLIGSLSSALY